jgi:hypothetical protein
VVELVDIEETKMIAIESGSNVVLVWKELCGGATVTTEAIEAKRVRVDVTEAGGEAREEGRETGEVPGLLEVGLTGCMVVGFTEDEPPAVPRGFPPRL